jgi:hypothetical protein
MSLRLRHHLLLWLIVGLPAAALAGQVDVTSAVDHQSVFIGDLINYTVSITYDSTVRLTPPPIGANLGGFDVKEYHVGEEQKLKGGRLRQTIDFKICTFTTGDYIIPGMPIQYIVPPDSNLKFISVDPLKITVKSLLADTTAVDTVKPRPLKGQISLARSHTTLYIFIAALALLAGTAAYVIIRRRRLKASEAFVDLRPAWEIAYADLALLKEQNLLDKGELKLFYFQMTEIIRKYLGKKFEFNAVDLTTSEIDDALLQMPVPDEIRSELSSFMSDADLVKFAKFIPPPDRPDRDWETAYNLVVKTKDIIYPEPLPPVPEPTPEIVPTPDSSADDNPEWKYAPPELRHRSPHDEREEKS